MDNNWLTQGFDAPDFNIALEDEEKRRRQLAQQAATRAQKPKVSGGKRLGINVAAFLAETGVGVASAVAAPVTGGGSLAAGFAAGAGIEALRRKALGEKQSLAASALEGGLTILPGVGKGVKALRGAHAISKAAKAADIAGDVRSGVNLTKSAVGAKPSLAMSALAKRAGKDVSQEAYQRGAAKVAARPAAKGFTSALDAQKFSNFDDFYKSYGKWFKGQGYSTQDARSIFNAAQKVPLGGTSTAAGGVKGLRPAATVQSQIEAAHAAGKTGEVQKLITKLPKQDQAAMRSALGLGGARPTVDASGKIVMESAKPSARQVITEGLRPKTTGFTTGRLHRGSEALRSQARGVQAGLRPQGAGERLTIAQAGDINQTLNKIGAKGSIGSQLRTVEAAQQKALTGIDDGLAKSNRVLDDGFRNSIRDKTLQQITGKQGGGIIGMTDAHRQLANDVSTRMYQAKDLKGLEQLRRAIDTRINYARNPASPDPVAEEVLKVFRRNIDDAVTQVAPDLKNAKTLFSQLEKAKDALIVNAPGAVGVRQQMGAGITGRLLGSAPAQAGLDVAGRGLGRAAQVTGSPITRAFVQQQVGRTLLKPPDEGAQAAPTGQLPESPGALFGGFDQELYNEPLPQGQLAPFTRGQFTAPNDGGPGVIGPGAGGDALGGQVLGAQTPSTGLDYSSSELFNAAIQELQKGNPKGSDALMQMAEMAAGLEQQFMEQQTAGSGGSMSADQRKAVSQAQNALSVIDQVEQAYGLAGGAQGAIVGTGRNILGKVRADQMANYYQGQKQGYLSRIVRAFGEVGTLNEGDIQRAAGLIPDLADTPDNATRKLQGLRDLLEEVRQRAMAGQYGFTGNELPSNVNNLFPQAAGF